MAGTTGKIQKFVRDQTITWDPGVVEEMKKHDLEDQTIDILGQEGFKTMKLISYMDDDVINKLEDRFALPLAQVGGIKRLVESFHQRREGNAVPTYNSQVVTERSEIIDNKLITRKQEDMLIKQAPKLCKIVKPLEVFVELRAAKCLTKEEMDRCRKCHTDYEQVLEMLHIIEKGTYKHYWSLVRALRCTDQKHAAKLLYNGELTSCSLSIPSNRTSKTVNLCCKT